MTKKLLLVPLVMANKKKYNVRKGFKWPKRYDTHEMTAMQCDDDDFGTSVWPAKWEKGSITWTCHVRATCLFSVFFFTLIPQLPFLPRHLCTLESQTEHDACDSIFEAVEVISTKWRNFLKKRKQKVSKGAFSNFTDYNLSHFIFCTDEWQLHAS